MNILAAASVAIGSAKANTCASGGSLSITASADSLTVAPKAATTFNFGEHVILTASASGFTISGYSWSIDGPTIEDYNENLGAEASPPLSAATPWSTTSLAPGDLAAAAVGFYWVPSSAQLEPNNGPFTRDVSLTVIESGGGSCSSRPRSTSSATKLTSRARPRISTPRTIARRRRPIHWTAKSISAPPNRARSATSTSSRSARRESTAA